jgi:hypothetical protein
MPQPIPWIRRSRPTKRRRPYSAPEAGPEVPHDASDQGRRPPLAGPRLWDVPTFGSLPRAIRTEQLRARIRGQPNANSLGMAQIV